MSDTLFASLDLIEPGDVVVYHGSIPAHHGLHIAHPCACAYCASADYLGSTDVRYRLTDPFAEDPDATALCCVRRRSITRSAANA
ncbi:hypothetical protein ACIGHB_29595 [Streptomyces sp. NPDC085460]|uniref:hypothetical protein n=1 Tax=Streptomyces sp. NPDC085460 TaxID=3365723 RepID=UPI0037D96454